MRRLAQAGVNWTRRSGGSADNESARKSTVTTTSSAILDLAAA